MAKKLVEFATKKKKNNNIRPKTSISFIESNIKTYKELINKK